MDNDISNRLSYIGITDNGNLPDSLINVIHSKDSNDASAFTQQSTNELYGKELRRTSLPVDTYRKSKLASWVQYNIPTPPSSRTNSNSSSHRSGSSARSSYLSDSTSSLSIPSPTSSPTSIEAPQLPAPIKTDMKPTPPRPSSLQSNMHTPMEDDQTKFVTPLRSTSSSTSSSASSLSSMKKKKKRLLPLVSRIRLCPYEKCSKHAPNIDPPEPPPQLLMSTLHQCGQHKGEVNKRKHHSSTNLDEQKQHDSIASYSPTPPPPPSSSSSLSLSFSAFPWYDCNHTSQTTLPSNDTSNDMPSSHQLRRRSSCPSKYSKHTTMQEAVMMRSFCSPGLQSSYKTPLTSATTNFSSSSSSMTSISLPPDVYDHNHDYNNQHHHQCLLSFSTMKPRSQPLRRRTSGKHEKKALRIWHDTLVESLKNEIQDGGSTNSSNTLTSTSSFEQQSIMSKEKRERNILTRKFILREFYLTEVTFWNQLYYSKVMFGDTLQDSLEQYGAFTRTSDLDLFANLPDLMQCSSQLIRSMAPYLDHPPTAKSPASTPSTPSTSHQEIPSTSNSTTKSHLDEDIYSNRHRRHLSHYESPTNTSNGLSSPSPSASANSNTSKKSTPRSNRLAFHLDSDARMLPSPNDQLLLGKELCMMANQFVVYLRCALDYKVNRKKLDHRSQHNKGFVMYQEKLSMRKETNQFYVHDFLIIPIQRIARYGLLLADLQKHTEKNHPDYYHISRARMILTSLAVAMNKAQQ